jgi:hypothetical protein
MQAIAFLSRICFPLKRSRRLFLTTSFEAALSHQGVGLQRLGVVGGGWAGNYKIDGPSVEEGHPKNCEPAEEGHPKSS